jgi:hypothetical protein
MVASPPGLNETYQDAPPFDLGPAGEREPPRLVLG